MNPESTPAEIRNSHQDCCVTNSYDENGCRLNMEGLAASAVVTLHGSNYQSKHIWQGRLCDRIIFGRLDLNFVCAAELKAGQSADVSTAIEQIQGGLNLANSLLPGGWAAKWHPLFVYSGSMPKPEVNVLQKKQVSFGGRKALVSRINCGSRLRDNLDGK